MTMPGWLPRVLVESALIVFSVLVALAVDEWRETSAREVRTREAVTAIGAELLANRAAAEHARTAHDRTHAMLKEVAGRKELPTVEQATSGLFRPATMVETAWTAARDTGALDPLPFEVLLKLSRAYEQQDKYVRLAAAIADDVYLDLRRRGVDAVLREGFQGFLVITSDFANREAGLVRVYDDVLATLKASPQ